MCLASVYEGSVESANLILTNVQRIECREGSVLLVDLFEREREIRGHLVSVDLVGNTAVICPED